ncbi:hypothetical protein BXZ70DRAFT_1065294 [Cristinia sonorae]|uniref:Fungal-type protein kinase domain-containing protein n=1 Tax=Cristinia sonorae TaxID=1940300 RepID=A0A8K0UN49_9AGAR|nr:hypothetical protein BXZ70DRAFT_1065294 [Cristinia sonorae]
MATPAIPVSPLKTTIQGTQRHAFTKHTAEVLQKYRATEVRGFMLGPVGVRAFMDKYMDTGRRKPPQTLLSKVSFHRMPLNAAVESDMYDIFLDVVNSSGLLANGFSLTNTSVVGEDGTKLKPDCGLVRDDDTPDSESFSWKWQLLELWIEFKRLIAMDPFTAETQKNLVLDVAKKGRILALTGLECCTSRAPLELEISKVKICSESSQEQGISDPFLREKILAFRSDSVSLELARQHRTFIFSLLICGDTARFMRWDRAGCTVSEHFNYRENPVPLAEFFWRYGRLPRLQRGFDPTVKVASDRERRRLWDATKDYIDDATNLRAPGMETTEDSDSDYPCYKIAMRASGPGRKTQYYIVQRPLAYPLSPIGRCTRAYVALDLSSGNLVFLKDYYRQVHPDHPPEADIYRVLKESQVPNLPTVYLAGDVEDNVIRSQTTMTQEWRRKPGICLSDDVRVYRHHRIVQELLFPLCCVKSSKQLVEVMQGIVECIAAAHDAEWLHRDVGVENIMLNKDGKGVLNDWDHGVQLIPTRIPSEFRSGTWQFASVAVSNNPNKAYGVSDDLESCYWALLYHALHHFKSNANLFNVDIFDLPEHAAGWSLMQGGREKARILDAAESPVTFVCKPLHDVLEQMRRHFMIPDGPPDEQDVTKPWTPILKIFSDVLARVNEWPEDDALPDRFLPRSKAQQDRDVRQAYQESLSTRERAFSRLHATTSQHLHNSRQVQNTTGTKRSVPDTAADAKDDGTKAIKKKKTFQTETSDLSLRRSKRTISHRGSYPS